MGIPADFSIIDPHIHQWDISNTPRILSPVKKVLGWNKRLYETAIMWGARRCDRDYVGKPDYVAHDYLPADYQRDVADLPIRKIVHVEAEWQDKRGLGPAGETAWVDQVFRQSATPDRLAGIVGYVTCQDAVLPQLLAAHRQASERFVGVRQMLAYSDDRGVMNFCRQPGLSRQPGWRKGFEQVVEQNLTFDAWFFSHQLDELIELATAYPEARIVLCHMGTPIGMAGPFASYGHTQAARDSIQAQWQAGMARLAECPNVSVKLSGFFMPVVGWGFHLRPVPVGVVEVVERFAPFVNYVIAQFGVKRCFFASNFPMDKVSLSLTELYDVYWQLTSDFTDEARRALFHDNAARFYGMAVVP